MPLPIYLVTFAIPVTYFLEILRGIVLRGADFIDLVPQTIGLAICCVGDPDVERDAVPEAVGVTTRVDLLHRYQPAARRVPSAGPAPRRAPRCASRRSGSCSPRPAFRAAARRSPGPSCGRGCRSARRPGAASARGPAPGRWRRVAVRRRRARPAGGRAAATRPTRSSSCSACCSVDVGGDAVGQKRHQHVFQHRALRQQMMLLKHEADLPAAERGQRGFVELERILARQPDAAGGRRLERADDRQQRALAGAAGAEDRQVFAAPQRERHAGEHAERLARRGILLDDVVDDEIGVGRLARP